MGCWLDLSGGSCQRSPILLRLYTTSAQKERSFKLSLFPPLWLYKNPAFTTSLSSNIHRLWLPPQSHSHFSNIQNPPSYQINQHPKETYYYGSQRKTRIR